MVVNRRNIARYIVLLVFVSLPLFWGGSICDPVYGARDSSSDSNPTNEVKDHRKTEFSWEMPGRLSVHDLQFGAAILKSGELEFQGNSRTFDAGAYGDRLTLMVRFLYKTSRSDRPIRLVVKVPNSRQHEETIRLEKGAGQCSFHFTIQRPEDFVGNGSVYIYYGFSIVDVLDFTIMPGS
jgi:hypothetical protein